jgi:hypothetical protein
VVQVDVEVSEGNVIARVVDEDPWDQAVDLFEVYELPLIQWPTEPRPGEEEECGRVGHPADQCRQIGCCATSKFEHSKI